MEILAKQIKAWVFSLWLLYTIAAVGSLELGADTPIEPEDQAWLNSLFYLPKEVRIRKEYRMLSDAERRNLHTAFVKLKQDESVKPNKYDLLVSIHGRRSGRNSAHRGTGFLGWHRVFMLLMENALREQVPGVTLAYWDSTLDAVLRKPRKSSIWSEDFMGNGDGFVATGAFKSWSTVQGSLFRTVGADEEGPLADKNITRLFKHVHVSKISLPLESYKDFEDIFEETHNRVHRWVGGEMRLIETAAQDPVFYIFHPFVDFVWEMFREQQRASGIDPETDWDLYYGQSRHHRYSPMGLGHLMAQDGASEIFAENIQYTPRPTCSRQQTDCQSPLLYCNVVVEKCVPWTIEEYKNIKKMARIKFMPFEFQAKKAIQEKVSEGFEELEKPKTTAAMTTPVTTQIISKQTVDRITDHHHDHDHTEDISDSPEDHDDEMDMHDHSQHKHSHTHTEHLVSFLKEHLSMMILAALLVFRVLFCMGRKCCAESKVGVRRTSRKYKLKGIVNVNYNEDTNKDTANETNENRPDNIYTITEICNDSSTLGQSSYVRFSRYIIDSEKNGDKNDKCSGEKSTRANRVEIKHDETGNKYVKNVNRGTGGSRGTSLKRRLNKEREDISEVNNTTNHDPADDYMDMNLATQISQSERQLPEDIFEKETNTSDIDIDDDTDSETRFNSIENENFELPLRATEDSFAFLDDYDNIDFIREAMSHDKRMNEESQRDDPVDSSQTSQCANSDYNCSGHI